ncbi:MAG: hypothetical protein KC776_34765 [Myxococcales bacterium]|nr:hypothetical protein [Myxococcales bacterium]MCB9581917.1 hypothetical protein [Polyangiaceae bacterium]
MTQHVSDLVVSTSERAPATTASGARVVAIVSCAALMGLVVRNAWIADDAFIAFRAVKNWVDGYGLVSNPGERVQAFTSPLNTLLIAAGRSVFPNVYSVALLLGLLSTAALAVLTVRASRSVAPVVLFASSGAFIDFSTSGLENALAHLLLAVFVLSFLSERRGNVVWLTAGLVVLNRLDHALLVAPAVALMAVEEKSWKRPLFAVVPVLAWEALSLVYYGFLLPNTAYAKLTTTLPRSELWGQGLSYFVESLQRDPVTLACIAGVVSAVLWLGDRRARVVALGIVAHLLYVVWIGGDFMSGRFFTAPFVVAVVLGVRQLLPLLELRARVALGAGALLVGATSGASPLRPLSYQCSVPPSGIVDERACYVEHTGLLRNLRRPGFQEHDYFLKGAAWRKSHQRVVASSLVGLAGFAAGPEVHVVDTYALTDPLLARIPFSAGEKWRIGHWSRPIPAGYLESLEHGDDEIKDSTLREYYQHLRRVVRGPLWSGERWRSIWLLNSGRLRPPG